MQSFGKKLEELLPLAESATKNENWPESIKLWRKIIRKYGAKVPPDAWYWLTKAYLSEDRLDKAEEAAAIGIRKFPKLTKLVILAAKLATTNNDWSLAATRWRQIIDAVGDKAPKSAWANLAKAERKLGNLEQAEEVIKDGLTNGGTDLELEQAEIKTVQHNWPAALKLWQQVLTEFKKDQSVSTTAKLNARFNISVIGRLVDIEAYKRQIKEYAQDQSPKKIAIVTSFTTGYDTLKPPEFLDKRFKYIAYTNEKVDGMGIYDVRPLPKPELDNARAIRYVKTHPHTLLSEYDVVVWADTSLMIVGDIYPLIKKFQESNLPIGSGVHPLRKNIYEELEANVKLGKEKQRMMEKQLSFYKKQGFEHNDLAENTLLMFNLKNPKLAPALETWWEQILRFSRRDQLSFNYSLAQNDTDWFRLTRPPIDIRNHPSFVMTAHHIKNQALAELAESLEN